MQLIGLVFLTPTYEFNSKRGRRVVGTAPVWVFWDWGYQRFKASGMVSSTGMLVLTFLHPTRA